MNRLVPNSVGERRRRRRANGQRARECVFFLICTMMSLRNSTYISAYIREKSKSICFSKRGMFWSFGIDRLSTLQHWNVRTLAIDGGAFEWRQKKKNTRRSNVSNNLSNGAQIFITSCQIRGFIPTFSLSLSFGLKI